MKEAYFALADEVMTKKSRTDIEVKNNFARCIEYFFWNNKVL
tara:strand:- start:354 stop:479 length:126 start_codon:yes stop_codon:yes gene_type:complete